MIIVEGWVRLAPPDIETVLGAARDMAKATRQEPGCHDYAFAIDISEPNLFRVIERWEDEAALAAHFATPHMAVFGQALAKAAVEGASVKAYACEYTRTLMGA